ncbi:MAG: hypothetical protein WD492_07440 [Alkalispirochaeta sp.]
MMQRWQWSAPANLLVAGEYAITSPGGLGVAVAVEPRATATVFLRNREAQPGRDLARRPGEIVAHTGDGTERIYPDAGHHLAEAIMAYMVDPSRGAAPSPEVATAPATATATDRTAPQWRIEVDTTAFFDAHNGAKQGLGSSAAAAVLLTAALFQLSGREPVLAGDEVIRVAIAAHRAANEGRGSGYDIATSALGGVIRFVGGEVPQWRRCSYVRLWNSHQLRVFGWFTGTSVASSGAVRRFDRYIPEGSRERTDFIARNNSVVNRIESASGWNDLFQAVSESRRLGEEIGESLGVPATIDICQPHRDDGWVVKASGAGNERAIILSQPEPRRSVPRRATAFPVSPEGLRWEFDADRDGPRL